MTINSFQSRIVRAARGTELGKLAAPGRYQHTGGTLAGTITLTGGAQPLATS